jgi:WD40 repeat protein
MKLCLLLATALVPVFSLTASGQVNFQRDVAPILVKRCLACHAEQKFKGEFQLHTFEALLKPGESDEAPITAGKPEESYLLTLITADDAEVRMPKDAPKLADEEIEVVRKWISEGAKLEGAEPTATLVNLAQWKHPDPPEVYPQPFPITALALRPDGAELAAGGLHEVTIWNVEDGSLVRRLKGFAERIYSIQYTKDGTQLAIAAGTPGQLGEVKMVSAADGALVRHFGSMADCQFSIALSPDEKRLATCGADHTVRVYDIASGKEELTIKDHSDWVMSVAWSPDAGRIATASRDKTCKVFDAKTGELVTTFPEHNECVTSIAYHPDGKHAISAGADNRIRYWLADDPGWENSEKMDKKKRHQIGESGGFNAPIQRLVVGGGQLFACAADQTARQFNVENRNQARSYSGHQEWVLAIDYHDATKRLATASLDGQVRIWKTDAKDEKELTQLTFFAAPGYKSEETAVTAPSGE